MSLRDQAFTDFKDIIRNTGEWGFTIDKVVKPDGSEVTTLVGLTTDISAAIDPDTGQIVSGRHISVALSIDDFGGEYPRNIHDSDEKPWRVSFKDVAGVVYEFKVEETIPDRAIGSLVLILEAYGAP